MKNLILPLLASSLLLLEVSSPVSAQTVTLGDYFVLPLGAEWIYEGFDWEGDPAKSVRRVEATDTLLTLYTGRSPAVAYTTNCVSLYDSYVDPFTMEPYDAWIDYMADGGRFGQFGDDGGESIRVDGGLIFPDQMAVGTSVTNSADAYLNGVFAGVVSMSLEVIETTALTVPAGHFPDVLHVRQTTVFPDGSQAHDDWWAKGVGRIKAQGISGGGAPEQWELIQYSVPPPPTPPVIEVNDGSLGVVSNRFGFHLSGQAGQVVVVEGSTNLVNWLPLQTNTLGSGPWPFSDPGSTNLTGRFYRARLLP